MYWKVLILIAFPASAFACGATDDEIRAMYGMIGFATFAGIALVVSVVLGVRALRKGRS